MQLEIATDFFGHFSMVMQRITRHLTDQLFCNPSIDATGNSRLRQPPYVNVTSTFFFDEAVNAGEQYCYQNSAVDASGNASVATDVTCATAPGTVVAGGTSNTGGGEVTPPVNTGEELTAPQVDVSNLACTNELDSPIEATTTLAAGCYVAINGIDVQEPANLTLEPGVIIKFGAGENLRVTRGGSLTARGTKTCWNQ